MVATAPSRRIERVPVLLVGLLDEAGKLPHAPQAVQNLETRRTRPPTIAEMEALTWEIEWQGASVDHTGSFQHPVGLIGWHDVYHWASGRDVREVVHLVGTARSVRNLVRHVILEARAAGIRACGIVDGHNAPMQHLLERMGTTIVPRHFIRDF